MVIEEKVVVASERRWKLEASRRYGGRPGREGGGTGRVKGAPITSYRGLAGRSGGGIFSGDGPSGAESYRSSVTMAPG